MGAFKGASVFFARPLWKVAERMGYSEDNVAVLKGDMDVLRDEFPQTYANLLSCVHHADRRSPLEYAQDLVSSWLVEDYFLQELASEQYQIALGGADRKRKLLSDAQTSSSSDFAVKAGDKSVRLELMNDYTGYWARSGKLHLRDYKYRQLQADRALFIAVSMRTREFVAYDFKKYIPARYIARHRPYGYKSAYELKITKNMMMPLSKENLERAVEEALSCRNFRK